MARSAPPLDAGDVFPTQSIQTLHHGVRTIPDDMELRWGLVLFYRAHW